jgi:lipopolysaccharide transport system permease protein
MQKFSISPREMFASPWRNRELLGAMVKRDVVGRYRGSIMGIAWSLFNPLIMLVIYTFVFSIVFKSRWGSTSEGSHADFAIILFVGMIMHGLFAECANRAPGLILANTNYVKKVIFPLDILPWVAFGSALFHAGISLGVLLVAQLIWGQRIPWTVLLFPLILLPLVFATMGFTWLLSALGVFVRDIGQMTVMFTVILMFVSPVFYPLTALPPQHQALLRLNPLTFIIEESRNTLLFGVVPDFSRWAVVLAASLAIAWGGFAWFQKTRRGFADVL